MTPSTKETETETERINSRSPEVKVNIHERLKRYVSRRRTYNYSGPFLVKKVKISRAYRDESGVGLYDVCVKCEGQIGWTVTLRYAQLYESHRWQEKYDKDKKLPISFLFPPKDSNCSYYKCNYSPLNDDELEIRRQGLEKWINGRISLIRSYVSEPEIMNDVKNEMCHLLKVGQYAPSLFKYNRNSSEGPDLREGIFSFDENDSIHFDKSFSSNAVPIKHDQMKNNNENISERINMKNTHQGDHDKVAPQTSYFFTQCRSIWVPKNWLYVFVTAVVFTLWALGVNVMGTLFSVYGLLEFFQRLEDYILFDKLSDIKADRQYSLSGMVRCIFMSLTLVFYIILHGLHALYQRSIANEI